MIPVEFFWIILVIMFGFIGSARGLRKELGATTMLLLSLFAAHMGEVLILSKVTEGLRSGALSDWPTGTIAAIYYSVLIIFVAFISYEGIVLAFPVKELTGVGKSVFGFLGGLLNGYLVIGTIWNAVAKADYFQSKLTLLAEPLSEFHNDLIAFLPLSLMENFSPYVMLVLGMILLLAIVLK